MKRPVCTPCSISLRKRFCGEQSTGTGRERCTAGEGRRLNLDILSLFYIIVPGMRSSAHAVIKISLENVSGRTK